MKADYYKAELIKESRDSRVYIVHTSENEKKILKKLLTPERIAGMQKEIKICRKIKSVYTDFPCSIPYKINDSSYIQNYIAGRHYSDFLFNSEQKAEISRQIIKLLYMLEGIEIEKNEQITWKEWKADLLQQLDKSKNAVEDYKLLDKAVLENTCGWIKEQLNTGFFSGKMVYVHNDLNKENIIINLSNNEIKVSFIDFEKLIVADPLKDISKLIWLFRADRELGDIFWQQYTKLMGSRNLLLLKAYWGLDIMKHLGNFYWLIEQAGWKKYLNEEMKIIEHFTEDNYKIW